MKKILLLGNGFTSHLIPEYSNEHMMNRLQNKAPQLLQIANENFEPFRIEGNIRNTQRGFGRCGSNRPKFDKPITGLPYNDKTITHINIKLINHGFHKRYDVNKLCKDYFQTYGLIFEIQKENISCVESLLKIVQLFQLINTFSESDSKELIKISNQIYWNNDKNDASILPDDKQHNIQAWFDNYDTIFTTNFDCIADDLFMKKEKALHLHGGFYFSDPWTKTPSKLSEDKAFLIWGISGDDKLKMMEGEPQSTASSQQQNKTSLFQKYLQKLESIEVNRLDIFGYSGENDQHINNAIINNPNIEEVLCFCDPKSIHGKNVIEKEEFEVKKRFIGRSGKRLIFESWDVVWNSISP